MSEILTIEEKDDITIITILKRKLYQQAVSVFQEKMQVLLDPEKERKKLIIDLSHVEIMNSSGLGVLIMTRDAMNQVGGELIIVGLKPFMMELFQRMRLDLLFNVVGSIEEGQNLLGGI